jgi:hypothetical protein
MKKVLFYFVLVSSSVGHLNAQEFKIAVNAGLPANVSNKYAAALDVSYLLSITDKFDIGLTSGFTHWFKRSEFNKGGINFSRTDEISIIPVALTSRFDIAKKFNLGIDLGYAIPIKSKMYQSGFYFAPKVQYGISKSTEIVLGYRVAKLDFESIYSSIDMLTLGIEFKL